MRSEVHDDRSPFDKLRVTGNVAGSRASRVGVPGTLGVRVSPEGGSEWRGSERSAWMREANVPGTAMRDARDPAHKRLAL